MKKYQNFLSENFHFLVVKFSVDLNRHVFVMVLLNSSYSDHLIADAQAGLSLPTFSRIMTNFFS